MSDKITKDVLSVVYLRERVLVKMSIVETAKKVAKEAFRGVLDDSGESYYEAHLLQVYRIIKEVAPNDLNLQAAAVLHDLFEDTQWTHSQVTSLFNKDVADLINEVTHEGKKDNLGYYFPRLLSKRGILLKFADRLSNLSRMGAWNEKRQAQYLKKSQFWKSEV